MKLLRGVLIAVLAGMSAACASLSPAETARIDAVVSAARSHADVCDRADACAKPSPLRELGLATATPANTQSSAQPVALAAQDDADRTRAQAAAGDTETNAGVQTDGATAQTVADRRLHHALILDYGQDALLARLNLIRSAQRSIEVQTYIFDEDDVGHLILDELLTAAQRGVKVRLLIDQLSALERVQTLAALAGAHVNFEMRIFNPVLGRARINYPMYAYASACCWRRLNQRMHNKLLIVDDVVGMTGGRNYQNDYYDWDREYNFRDRDLLLAGPVVTQMRANFDAYWNARRSKRLTALSDVGRSILRYGVPAVEHPEPENPLRIVAISRDADDLALVRSRLADAAIPVRGVSYIGDPPDKYRRESDGGPSSRSLRDLIERTQNRLLLQTPYLVLSKPAQQLFRDLQQGQNPPRVLVSTNSLAATDSFIPYALSYKYKRRYLRDFKFEIFEFKPFPQDAPIDVEATGAVNIIWRADGTAMVSDDHFSDAGGAPGRAHHTDTHEAGDGKRAEPMAATRTGNRGDVSDGGRTPLTREYSALRYSRPDANDRVPLKRGGVRFGLHAKSLVIDDRIGVIGTHNFDPRGENYNTESVVVIEDATFARALAASIERDMSPANAWMIARRDKPPVFSGLDYSMAKISEYLPLFDFWPTRYATSYEFKPGPDCPTPMSPRDAAFRRCYEPVGDFPEVGIAVRPLTRIFTAFGAGLAPIL